MCWQLMIALAGASALGADCTTGDLTAAFGYHASGALVREAIRKLEGFAGGSLDDHVKDIDAMLSPRAAGTGGIGRNGTPAATPERSAVVAAGATAATKAAPPAATGRLAVRAAEPAAFVRDPAARESVLRGIAALAGVDHASVSVTLAPSARRQMGAERRLGANVQVSYSIAAAAVPSQASHSGRRRMGAERRLSPDVRVQPARMREASHSGRRRMGAERRLSPYVGEGSGAAAISSKMSALTSAEVTAAIQDSLDRISGPGAHAVTRAEVLA